MENTEAQRVTRRRRIERLWVILGLSLFIILAYSEGWFFQLQTDMPLFGNISLFALINLNLVLLLLLSYLVLRNIVKLAFERKRNILGHKLRTRLVVAFIGLTLIPTVPLFWFATQFIFSSLDNWFSYQVEQSLEQSVNLARDYLDQEGKDLGVDCRRLRAELAALGHIPATEPGPEGPSIQKLLEQYHMDGLFFFDKTNRLVWEGRSEELPEVEPFILKTIVAAEEDTIPRIHTFEKEERREGLVARVRFAPEGENGAGSPGQGEMIVVRLVPIVMVERLASITSGFDEYLQLKMLQAPLKQSHFITFSIVTLMAIFAAIWLGFFLAKGLTGPIQAMASATKLVADGDLDVQIEVDRNDEIGMLMGAFNNMVRDLREGRDRLDSAYSALQLNHEELEDRRRYMEIVLSSIGAGVVSVNASGLIMTINKSAEESFGFEPGVVHGRHYVDILQPSHLEIVESFIATYLEDRQPHIEKQVQVIAGNRSMVLMVKASVLLDEQGGLLGVVAVMDDLTELERAQRMAAWREVARRIAHEIKNPLTPIQLCTQRLRRKYAGMLEPEGSVFDECTRTIVQQVDRMKHLVNEFSKFARLPRARVTRCDLAALVEDSLVLYRHTYPRVTFAMECEDELPELQLDPDQFKQVMINLMDNGVHALPGEGGEITVRLSREPELRIVRLECADNGHGVSPEDKLRMFEPYYSNREKGTGLGLAIVSSIIADHNGFVRVLDNEPRGTVIVIELPG